MSARKETLTLRLAKLSAPWLLALCAACDPGGPPLTATDIVAVAPLPGRTFSAAYLTLHNHGPDAVTISRVSSPDFAKVEVHESLIADDVIRMRRLDSVIIDAESSAIFESGGKHLMLIGPRANLVAGNLVTLQFEYDDEGLLIVSTTLIIRK